jgi:hypothetical protein
VWIAREVSAATAAAAAAAAAAREVMFAATAEGVLLLESDLHITDVAPTLPPATPTPSGPPAADSLAPPYHGTAWYTTELYNDTSPTAFTSLTHKGCELRTMFDRRSESFDEVTPHLFDCLLGSSKTIEVQVNPEFTQVEAEVEARCFVLRGDFALEDAIGSHACSLQQWYASRVSPFLTSVATNHSSTLKANKYMVAVGRLPACLLADVLTVWIHKGKHGFGGGNDNLLIHTEMGEEYIRERVLTEVFVHESTHTSVDAAHATAPGWVAAQQADRTFISEYARDNPVREDLAECMAPYFACRHRPEILPLEQLQLTERTVGRRFDYLHTLGMTMDICT